MNFFNIPSNKFCQRIYSCTTKQNTRRDKAYKCFYCLSDSRLSAEHHWQETEQQLLHMETQRISNYIKLIRRKAAKSHPSGFQTLYSSSQRRDAPPSLASLMPKYVAAGSLNVCFSLPATRCVLPTLTRPLHWRPHRKVL